MNKKIKNSRYKIVLFAVILLFFSNKFSISIFAEDKAEPKIKYVSAWAGWLFSIHTKDICGALNLKISLTWKLFNKYKLETTYLYLWEKIQCFKSDYYSEFSAYGLMFNLKFPIKKNIWYGGGPGIFLANYVHPLIDATYFHFTPGLYLKIEFLPTDFVKFEFMYLFIPLDLRDYSYNKYAFMHIFTISIEVYWYWGFWRNKNE